MLRLSLFSLALLLAAPPPAVSKPARSSRADRRDGAEAAHPHRAAPPGETPGVAGQPAPASQPAASRPAEWDPSRLRVVIPRDRLAPLRSVRSRDKQEAEDRSRKGTISISINTIPKGASVTYGRKSLGSTPLTLTAHRGSTPLDVVIRRGGYMTLRTRIMRRVTRSYTFKLTPAKLR